MIARRLLELFDMDEEKGWFIIQGSPGSSLTLKRYSDRDDMPSGKSV